LRGNVWLIFGFLVWAAPVWVNAAGTAGPVVEDFEGFTVANGSYLDPTTVPGSGWSRNDLGSGPDYEVACCSGTGGIPNDNTFDGSSKHLRLRRANNTPRFESHLQTDFALATMSEGTITFEVNPSGTGGGAGAFVGGVFDSATGSYKAQVRFREVSNNSGDFEVFGSSIGGTPLAVSSGPDGYPASFDRWFRVAFTVYSNGTFDVCIDDIGPTSPSSSSGGAARGNILNYIGGAGVAISVDTLRLDAAAGNGGLNDAQPTMIDNITQDVIGGGGGTPVPGAANHSAKTITFPAESGKDFQPQFCDDLTSGVWTDLGNVVNGSGSPEMVFFATTGPVFRAYRVVELTVLPTAPILEDFEGYGVANGGYSDITTLSPAWSRNDTGNGPDWEVTCCSPGHLGADDTFDGSTSSFALRRGNDTPSAPTAELNTDFAFSAISDGLVEVEMNPSSIGGGQNAFHMAIHDSSTGDDAVRIRFREVTNNSGDFEVMSEGGTILATGTVPDGYPASFDRWFRISFRLDDSGTFDVSCTDIGPTSPNLQTADPARGNVLSLLDESLPLGMSSVDTLRLLPAAGDGGSTTYRPTQIDNIGAGMVMAAFGDPIGGLDLEDAREITFPTVFGRQYQPQYSDDGGTTWFDIGDVLTGSGGTDSAFDLAVPGRQWQVLELTTLGVGPAVLVCSPNGTAQGYVDLDWLTDLFLLGFKPDYLDSHRDFSWSRISQYNVLILYGSPAPDASQAMAFLSAGPRQAEYISLIEQFLAAGGGVFMMVHTDNGDEHVRPVIEPWGARLPLEWYIETDPAKIEPFPRMRNDQEAMCLVDQVLPSPISSGTEKVWLPYGLAGADNSSWTGPISVDANWQVVIKGSATSVTDPLDDQVPPMPLPPDPLFRPGGVAEPELMALRQYGNGRIVLCSQWPVFTIGQGTQWLHNRRCLSRGIASIPSDFEEIMINALNWLAEPSLASENVGGYQANLARLEPSNNDPAVQAEFPATPWPSWKLDMSQPSDSQQGFVGLIGARTTRTGGTGSVLDYANAAKQVGLDFVIFMESFPQLTQAELTSLGTECLQHSDNSVLMIPGYTMDSNIGNHLFFSGHNLPWPTPLVLTGPGETLLNIQFQEDNGSWGVNDAVLDWILSSHDRYNGQMVGYYNFDDPRAMQMPDLKLCSAQAIRFYDNGTLVEDQTQAFIDSAEGTITQSPVSVNLVDSPAELIAEVQSGNSLTHARASSLSALPAETLRWNGQYDGPRLYASDGPTIHAWTKTDRAMVYGAEPFVVNLEMMAADLDVSAPAGLQEIKVWNGNRLIRRILPKGVTSYRQILQLPSVVQQNLVLEVIDNQGGKAVSYPRRSWKSGSMNVVFCGDHVNDCGRQYLSRGTGIFQSHRYPLFQAGYSWDGGPRGERPVVHFGRTSPSLNSSLGVEGSDSLHNIPIMEFADDQAIVVRSTLDEAYDPVIPHVNPWHTYGPMDPSLLLSAVRQYTEFNRPLTGVRGTGWGAIGDRSGAVLANFKSDITFKQALTVNQLVVIRSWWNASRPNIFLITGTPNIVVRNLATYQFNIFTLIRTGEWFGIYSSEAYNNVLFINRGDDVRINVLRGGNQDYLLHVDADLQSQAVSAGEEKQYELFSISDPLDVASFGQGRIEAVMDYLAQPEGMEVLQGTRLITPGFFDVETSNPDTPVELRIPSPTNPMQLTLPVRVSGLCTNWSAGLLQIDGHTTGYYTDGENEYTSLGFDYDGRVYAALYPDQAPLTHVVIGHPIVCDNPDVIIESMPRADAAGNLTWHIAVNNPTDTRLWNVTFSQGMSLPGLNFPNRTLTILEGKYQVLQL